jgi:hypothetical protein
MEALLKRCRIHSTVALRVAGRGPEKKFQQLVEMCGSGSKLFGRECAVKHTAITGKPM